MAVEDDIGVTMRGQEFRKSRGDAGYAMAALLVTLAVMTVLMSVAMPSWRHLVQREREAELIFRGEQYARAVGLFQRKFAGAFPPSIDVLYQQKFLRKKYKDPMTADGEFQVLYQSAAAQPGVPGTGGVGRPAGNVGPTDGSPVGAGPPPPEVGGPSSGATSSFGPGMATGTAGPQGGVIGVVSKSTKRSIRIYNGRNTYNQWQFLYTQVTTQGGQNPGAQQAPGQGGTGGRQGTGRQPSSRPGTGDGFGTQAPRTPGMPGPMRPTSPR
jgi:type II secretory pathway pseudopilin PulG